MKMMRLILSLIFSVIFVLYNAHAESQRHPRVSELEKNLSREGLELMKGRFPDRPFLVTVKIDPLMRERRGGTVTGEKLPYFDMAEEEVIDEWDDPSITNSALLNRVRKIYVNVSIPSNLTDDEVAELKTTLISNLGLLEARDTVEVSKRNWGLLDDTASLSWKMLGWGAFGWALLMAGLFGLFWYATSRLGQAFKDSQTQSQKGSGGGLPAASMNYNQDSADKKNLTSGADLKFNDPIKNREIIATGVRILSSHKGFPNLEDMQLLQKFADEKPQDCGALLSEFPIELRKKIFSYSFSNAWLDAMVNPGEVTSSCVEILNRCLRIQRNDNEIEWQELLIIVSRLGDKNKDFFRGMNQGDAFAILSALPKSMALGISRENFPGAWGVLLDPNFKSSILSNDKISTNRQRAITLEPLREFTLLNKYKNEKELMEFLKTSDPGTEKEVYQVAGEKSLIWSIRPPFYKIFELEGKYLDQFVPSVRIDDWSLAMFNIARSERKEIEKRFSDKQRFRYFEILKSYDSSPPSKIKIGEIRERIAALCESSVKQWSASQEESPSVEKDVVEKNAA